MLATVVFILVTTVVAFFGPKWYKSAEIGRKLSWLTSVPGWPIIGNVLEFGVETDVLYDLLRLTRKYGNMVLIKFCTQQCILSADYEFFEFVLGTQHVLEKSSDYNYFRSWLGTGLLTSRGIKWKKHRRMITPAFHFSILENFVDIFEENGKILIKKLESEVNKDSTEIYKFINLYTMDVICETAMGVTVNAQVNEDSRYVRNVKEIGQLFMNRAFSIYKGNDLLYMLSLDYYKEKKVVKELHDVTYSVIDARRKELEKNRSDDKEVDDTGIKSKKAFLDILLQSTIDGMRLSKEEIREEVDTFMFGGHDTTSSAISFTLYLLSKNQDVQKLAFDEQKEIFGDDIHRNCTYSDLNEMKYLDLVFKESLRIFPPATVIGREVTKDVEYKGKIIPAGTDISIFTYGAHHDPKNFPDPEKFDPLRFTTTGTKPYSYVPFSAGPRNCIGQKFAVLEAKSCLSKILRNFELQPASPEHELELVSEMVLKSKNGMRMKLVNRK
ncbi:hypothetical protein NQ317_003792 [Molorchus minor]|uniref:Cytochrome P450 n=1 Tax=Molorchus minor TaxID=1323400 RepID=A0ABQ9JWF2_9CUCU|nr:hypothetical protein NQ317_003792 [Molorchus minor]